MPAKRKKKTPAAMESVAASEHATEGKTERSVIDLTGKSSECFGVCLRGV